jgi:hypothetical protein
MPGYNHYSSCTCGWCLKAKSKKSNEEVVQIPNNFQSFVNPNAICPVCGARVFYYQAPSGGRVFFDELGPPWSKHPCTTSAKAKTRKLLRKPAVRINSREPQWLSSGWAPIVIDRTELRHGWCWVAARRLQPGKVEKVFQLVPWDSTLSVDSIAFMKPVDEFGIGKISWVGRAGPKESLFVHRTFERCSPVALEAARDGGAEESLQVAEALYVSWGVSVGGRNTYPKFVNASLARRWYERAISLGAKGAKLKLEAFKQIVQQEQLL